jgi:hypothetical protein
MSPRVESVAFAVLAFVAPALLAAAQQPGPAPLPSADQVIDRYVQAVGGKAAVAKLTTRRLKGSLVASAGSASVEIDQKVPGKFLIVIDSPASGLSKNGCDGTVAWSQNQQRGLREVSGPEVENFKREYDLHREIRLKELYPSRTLKSQQKIGDRQAYELEAVAADGQRETMFFDVETGLLLRRDVMMGDAKLEAWFEDYKTVDGVAIPLTVRRSRPDFTFTYKFTEAVHNVPIADAVFAKPPAP